MTWESHDAIPTTVSTQLAGLTGYLILVGSRADHDSVTPYGGGVSAVITWNHSSDR